MSSVAGCECKKITIINGWGAQASLWTDFITQLNPRYQITLIDLPLAETDLGYDFSLADLAADLDRQIVAKTHIIAWSLGANVAMAFANQHSDKVASLLTIAANPKFIQGDGWGSGMPRDIFGEFYQSLLNNELKALKLFAGLQAVGDHKEKALLKKLRQLISKQEQLNKQVLAAGLNILASVDQREYWLGLNCPEKHVYGENDNLVPAEVAEFSHNSVVMRGVSHAPMLSATTELVAIVEEFIA
jgi:pimeloyl-[acyl-carrier protein] methyl ester esterase